MAIKLTTGQQLVTDAPLKETIQSGILTNDGIRISGASEFRLPLHQDNLIALNALIAPDAPRPRPKYLDIVSSEGQYDRIYYISKNSAGIAVRIEWSQDPLLLASRTPINEIDLGTFTYSPTEIQARQNTIVIPQQGANGVQYPTVQFGQIWESSSLVRRPHIAWAHHRPHINPHWFLFKAFCQLGYTLNSSISFGGPARQDVAYLLDKEVGAGMESNRYLRLSRFDAKSLNSLGEKAFYPTNQGAIPQTIDDPQNRFAFSEVYAPLSGVYKFSIKGLAATLPALSSDASNPFEDRGYLVQCKIVDVEGKWPIATISANGSLNSEELAEVGNFYSFDHEEEVWLSQGQRMEILISTPNDVRGFAHPLAYYSAGTRSDRPNWPNAPYTTLTANYSEGLVIEVECVRSWFTFGTQIDWRNILRQDVTVLDVLKGVMHFYNLKYEFVNSERALFLRPANETIYGNNTLAPHYLDQPPTLIGLRQVSTPESAYASSQRADEIEVGFASGNDHAYTYTRENTSLDSVRASSSNPLFVEVEERIIATVRDSAFITGEYNGNPIRVAANARLGVINNTSPSMHPYPSVSDGPIPEWDIEPYILRYFGNTRKKFIPNDNLNFSLLEGAAASLQEVQPGQGIEDNVRNFWFPAYAAHVTSLENFDGTQIETPPLAYNGDKGSYNLLWRTDFESRYQGDELLFTYECSRVEAHKFTDRERYIVDYEGRPILCVLISISAIDNDTAKFRFVAVQDQDCLFEQGVTCSLNAASVLTFVENEEAWATFGYSHQETPISITTEVSIAFGPWVAYVPGDKLLYRGGALSFRTTVQYPSCPDVLVAEDVGVIEQSIPCGDTPAIGYSYDSATNTASFTGGPDIIDFPFSDVFEVDIDGAGYVPYTEGSDIVGFTQIVVRRTAQRTAGCPAKVGTLTLEATTPSSPNVSAICQNTLALNATSVNGRVTLHVDESGLSSPNQYEIKTRLDQSDRWVDYLGQSLSKKGEVFVIAEYSDGCPNSKLHYAFELDGTLTPLGNTAF